jgi:hypothetical protein
MDNQAHELGGQELHVHMEAVTALLGQVGQNVV